MDKIPCIKCTPELWEYIKPYLKEWSYSINDIESFYKSPLLCINRYGLFGQCTNLSMECIKANDRELVTDVEEFLERAAKLKGFTYKRKDVMEINGIEIKPGMVINLKYPEVNGLISYVVFSLKHRLAVIQYDTNNHYRVGYWTDSVNDFYDTHKDYIEEIRDVTDNAILDGGTILWKKPKEIILTMDEIAEKFGYPVEQLRIKK